MNTQTIVLGAVVIVVAACALYVVVEEGPSVMRYVRMRGIAKRGGASARSVPNQTAASVAQAPRRAGTGDQERGRERRASLHGVAGR